VVDTFELYIGGGFYMPFNLADLGILFGFFGMTFYLLRDLLPLRSKLDVSPEW
jgi:lipoprotein signal peptidase